ncbi:MAG: site-2 protease family protein [bacterium]|nr:site-2 protease family protein [bacterium]
MPLFIFQLLVLLGSVIIHEVAHGAVAERLGDPTARLLGRITLNPLKHIDPVGSILVPLFLSLIPGGVVFGWAKPVPYNPANLKRPDRDGALIALAGPVSNLILAVVFGIVVRVLATVPGYAAFIDLATLIVIVNISLAIFNLVPIPPLDGSKLLYAILPASAGALRQTLERYGLFILVAFIWFGAQFLGPIIFTIFRFLVGS